MPNSIVKSLAEKTGKKTSEIETEWNKIKGQAEKRDVSNVYAYTNAVLHKIEDEFKEADHPRESDGEFTIVPVKKGQTEAPKTPRKEHYFVSGVGMPSYHHHGELSEVKQQAESKITQSTSFIQIRNSKGGLVTSKENVNGWADWNGGKQDGLFVY